MKKLIAILFFTLNLSMLRAQLPTYSLNDDFNWHFNLNLTDFINVNENVFYINDTSNFILLTDTFEFGGQKITEQIINNWNYAFTHINDHSSAGYSTANNTQTFTNKSGLISLWTNNIGYTSFSDTNVLATKHYVLTRGFITGINSGDVTTALGYTPASTAGSYSNPSWITSLSKSKITFSGSVSNYIAADGSEIPFPDIDAIPIGTRIEGYWVSPPDGYLFCRGGTIGDASSGATVLANALAEDLFLFLWNNIADAELSVSGGRGASAAADWAAHKAIELPDERGRVPVAKSTSGDWSTLAGVDGPVDMTYSIDPPSTASSSDGSHNHTGTTGAPSATVSVTNVALQLVASSTHTHTISSDGAHSHSTNVAPFNAVIKMPGISVNVAIKY